MFSGYRAKRVDKAMSESVGLYIVSTGFSRWIVIPRAQIVLRTQASPPYNDVFNPNVNVLVIG